MGPVLRYVQRSRRQRFEIEHASSLQVLRLGDLRSRVVFREIPRILVGEVRKLMNKYP